MSQSHPTFNIATRQRYRNFVPRIETKYVLHRLSSSENGRDRWRRQRDGPKIAFPGATLVQVQVHRCTALYRSLRRRSNLPHDVQHARHPHHVAMSNCILHSRSPDHHTACSSESFINYLLRSCVDIPLYVILILYLIVLYLSVV